LCYNTQKRALSVVIKRCINLLAMDKNGFSDAFVKLYIFIFMRSNQLYLNDIFLSLFLSSFTVKFRRQLRPDPSRKKYKTTIKWRNLNPVFNEEFFFETSPNHLEKQSLIITVWDKDIGLK
jgi:Ca2+-dependent lipid-binding protein